MIIKNFIIKNFNIFIVMHQEYYRVFRSLYSNWSNCLALYRLMIHVQNSWIKLFTFKLFLWTSLSTEKERISIGTGLWDSVGGTCSFSRYLLCILKHCAPKCPDIIDISTCRVWGSVAGTCLSWNFLNKLPIDSWCRISQSVNHISDASLLRLTHFLTRVKQKLTFSGCLRLIYQLSSYKLELIRYWSTCAAQCDRKF